MVESHKEKIKTYEREIKRLEQLNYEQINSRHGSGIYQERKMAEMVENERQLQEELIRLKSMIEKASMHSQKEFERERESFKKKLLDQELRIKKLETEKNLMIFEQEKQKTKWNIEKDHLISSKTEFLESLDRLKKQKDQLLKENEKIKNDLKLIKKNGGGTSLFAFIKNRSEAYSAEKTIRSSNEFGGTNHKTEPNAQNDSDDDLN